MSRKSCNLSLFEVPGSLYPDLQTAQKSAVSALARSMEGTLKALIANGLLITVDGNIIPNPERRL